MNSKAKFGGNMLIEYEGIWPEVDQDTFLAQNCTIIGKCKIEENCSIWFNAVLRADVNSITIGKNSNIQDNTVVHCDPGFSTNIGENVTVGHSAIIHGCSIGSNCIIGMGATILDGAAIGSNCIIGANSLITSGKTIPDGVLVMGAPGKVVRELTKEEIEAIKHSTEGYVKKSKKYMSAKCHV